MKDLGTGLQILDLGLRLVDILNKIPEIRQGEPS